MKRSTLALALLLVLLVAWAATACSGPTTVGAPVPPDLAPETRGPDWQRVPAGDYLEGQFDHAATLPYDYEMMTYPVTNAQFAAYLNAALADGSVTLTGNEVTGPYPGDPFLGARHEEAVPAGDWLLVPVGDPASRLTFDGSTVSVIPGYETHPATMVSWFGAWSTCQAMGGRLPLDAEWTKAARGTGDRPFPWGHEIDGAYANFAKSGDPFDDAGGTTPVGFYKGAVHAGYATADGASPYGLHDMAGNVWEWTGDVHPGTHNRSLRGGSYTNYGYDLRIWSHNSAPPEHVSPSVGFRCARDPQGTP